MKHSLALLVLIIGSCVGCQTQHGSQSLQSATDAVLQEHHFAPLTFMNTAGGLCATAVRFRSLYSIQIACVCLQANGQSRVELASYQYITDNWARLGRLFDPDNQTEAEEIQRAVESRLRKP